MFLYNVCLVVQEYVSLDSVRPWLGHGKARRRRKLRRRTVPPNRSMAEEQDQQSSSQQDTSQNEDDCPCTKSGRKVKKPRHYCLKSSFPDGSARLGGGSCNGSQESSYRSRESSGRSRD